MPEILLYRDDWAKPGVPSSPLTPLELALKEIGRNVGAGDSKYDEPISKAKALLN